MPDDLTPEGLVDYPLKHSMRGYHVEQVDNLLDAVADRLEQLERELDARRRAQAEAENRAASSSETEATLRRTLVTAQRAAEETVAEAEARAARIVADAEEEAESLLAQARVQAEQVEQQAHEQVEAITAAAERARQGAERRIEQLRSAADAFEVELRRHLDLHRALLDQAPQPPTVDEPDVAPPPSPHGEWHDAGEVAGRDPERPTGPGLDLFG